MSLKKEIINILRTTEEVPDLSPAITEFRLNDIVHINMFNGGETVGRLKGIFNKLLSIDTSGTRTSSVSWLKLNDISSIYYENGAGEGDLPMTGTFYYIDIEVTSTHLIDQVVSWGVPYTTGINMLSVYRNFIYQQRGSYEEVSTTSIRFLTEGCLEVGDVITIEYKLPL